MNAKLIFTLNHMCKIMPFGRGIIMRNKTIADKLKYIPNSDKQNYPFFRLILFSKKFNSLEPTIQHLIKVPKGF